MKLLDLRKISIGIQELQEAEINTLLAYKLSIIKNKIQPHEEAIVEAVYDFADKHKEKDNANELIKQEELNLLQEEVDIELPKIKLSQLPKETKGKIAMLLFPIIEDDSEEAEPCEPQM